jgi:hypothetical protein
MAAPMRGGGTGLSLDRFAANQQNVAKRLQDHHLTISSGESGCFQNRSMVSSRACVAASIRLHDLGALD